MASFGALSPSPLLSPESHKFDKDFGALTLREYFSRQLRPATRMLKAIESRIGEDQLLSILHSFSIEEGRVQGRALAEQHAGRDFHSYNERFRSGEMQEVITYGILEDSEKVFAIEVTECILVRPVVKEGAGKIGNEWLCNMDFGHAEGYDPRIKLVRDKTLMKGDTCCNHRYLWTG